MSTLKLVTAIFLFSFINNLSAQSVGVGTTNPSPAAILDVSSTNKGLLIPRMTTAERNLIPTPLPSGLLIFNTTTNTFQFYGGTTWSDMSSASTNTGNSCDSVRKKNIAIVYDAFNAYAFYVNPSGQGVWVSQGLNTATYLAASSMEQVVLYSDFNMYVFTINNAGVGAWAAYSNLSSGTHTAVAADNHVVVYTNFNAYAFYQDCAGNVQRVTVSINSDTYKSIASKSQSVVYGNFYMYAFCKNKNGNGAWVQANVNSATYQAIASETNIMMYSSFNGYSFAQNSLGDGVWTSQSFNSLSTPKSITTK